MQQESWLTYSGAQRAARRLVSNGGSKRETCQYARLAKEVSTSMHKQYCKHQATEVVKCIYMHPLLTAPLWAVSCRSSRRVCIVRVYDQGPHCFDSVGSHFDLRWCINSDSRIHQSFATDTIVLCCCAIRKANWRRSPYSMNRFPRVLQLMSFHPNSLIVAVDYYQASWYYSPACLQLFLG